MVMKGVIYSCLFVFFSLSSDLWRLCLYDGAFIYGDVLSIVRKFYFLNISFSELLPDLETDNSNKNYSGLC